MPLCDGGLDEDESSSSFGFFEAADDDSLDRVVGPGADTDSNETAMAFHPLNAHR